MIVAFAATWRRNESVVGWIAGGIIWHSAIMSLTLATCCKYRSEKHVDYVGTHVRKHLQNGKAANLKDLVESCVLRYTEHIRWIRHKNLAHRELFLRYN
jgi:hypothetical protein